MCVVAAAERTAKSAEAVLDQLQTRRADALKSATMDQVHHLYVATTPSYLLPRGV
jgi:hypothetical protein